jgi:hypothetical protein
VGLPKSWIEQEYNGCTWYWCGKLTGGKCEKWHAHNPKECKGDRSLEEIQTNFMTKKLMSDSSSPFSRTWQLTLKDEPDKLQKSMVSADFNLNGPTSPTSEGQIITNVDVILNEADRQPTSDMTKLLMFHHHYGDKPFPRLQKMAQQGQLPKQLATCRIPTCAAFHYSKATRQPWRWEIVKTYNSTNQT